MNNSAKEEYEEAQAAARRSNEGLERTALEKQVGGSHYKHHAIQHVVFCQRNGLRWCESAAIKYIVRHREKNGAEDIKKAIHYLELLLELEYPASATPSTPE